MAKKVLIDCDPGIDDALAIALAHGDERVEVVGITTVGGNVDLDNTTNNALCLTEYFGMRAPVVGGAGRPLVRERRRASDVHGANGLADIVLPAAKGAPQEQHAIDFIIDALAAAPGEISLVAIGPLTNIALALRKEPRIAEWAAEFVIMGGSCTRGNNTPAAEFNIAADPEAAAVAFGAPWRTTMVGLDLTLQARASPEVRSRFTDLGRLERELITPCLDFMGRHAQYRDEGPAVHDACAMARVIDPGLITAVPARVDVETRGEFTSGMTVVDFREVDSRGTDSPDSAVPHNADVATVIDREAFWTLLVDALHRVARNTEPANL